MKKVEHTNEALIELLKTSAAKIAPHPQDGEAIEAVLKSVAAEFEVWADVAKPEDIIIALVRRALES